MDVQRVNLPRDVCDGHESFVVWLERQEKNQVGVEDGVFVVENLTFGSSDGGTSTKQKTRMNAVTVI